MLETTTQTIRKQDSFYTLIGAVLDHRDFFDSLFADSTISVEEFKMRARKYAPDITDKDVQDLKAAEPKLREYIETVERVGKPRC